ncbi:hypothetical protein KPL78_06325 [Roseomonas sp. HJA6]|uniref:Protein kinase domain-containing protein n=1 Tax=Roseomonas alba TaxID=2846776 RepID=A0ABS7A5U6_9PROT|nr:protein kinase [Neoroseomonas alba]MBW6397455.1 hypothetical protein [Neoroseomonas alba]
MIVGDLEFKNYKILAELGAGANGVVYQAVNTILQREEAVKVWRSRSSRDFRNKIEQGLREAQKLARASPQFAVTVYSAQEFGGALIATMEYVAGKTLKWYQENSGPILRIQLAEVYLNSIVHTTTESTRHGDAHMKNVLVFEEKKTKHDTVLRMKFCDFGTSIYSGKEASEQRHWQIVRNTVISLTHGTENQEFCLSVLDKNWPIGRKMAMDAYAARENGIDFSDLDIAQMWAAPLKDYINDLKILEWQKAGRVGS